MHFTLQGHIRSIFHQDYFYMCSSHLVLKLITGHYITEELDYLRALVVVLILVLRRKNPRQVVLSSPQIFSDRYSRGIAIIAPLVDCL